MVLLLWIFYVFFLSCVCYVFVRVCLYVLCGHLLGKGLPLGSRLWCLTVSLSLSHWYPGSSVVLDCIDSWSLHPYLLSKMQNSTFCRNYSVLSAVCIGLKFMWLQTRLADLKNTKHLIVCLWQIFYEFFKKKSQFQHFPTFTKIISCPYNCMCFI